MQELGHHFIAELWECPEGLLDDPERLQQISLESAETARVTVISSQFHRFSPQGVTGILLLAESHLSLHTWPEHGYCAMDLFTCGDFQAAREAIHQLSRKLQAGRVVLSEMKRGLLEESPMAMPRLKLVASSHGNNR